jgi:hypothetical protein
VLWIGDDDNVVWREQGRQPIHRMLEHRPVTD